MAVQAQKYALESTQGDFSTEVTNFRSAYDAGTLDDDKIAHFMAVIEDRKAGATRAELLSLKYDVVLPLYLQTNRIVAEKKQAAGGQPDPQLGFLMDFQDKIRNFKGELNTQISHGPKENTIVRWFAQQAGNVVEKVATRISHLRLVKTDNGAGQETAGATTVTANPAPELTIVKTEKNVPAAAQAATTEDNKAGTDTSLKIVSTTFSPEEKIRERQSRLMNIRLRAMEVSVDAFSGEELAAYKSRVVSQRLEEARQEIRNRYKPEEYQGTIEQKRAAFLEKEKDLVTYAKSIAALAGRINEKLAEPKAHVDREPLPAEKKENTIVRWLGNAVAYLKPQVRTQEAAEVRAATETGRDGLDKRWAADFMTMREKTIHAQVGLLTGERLQAYKDNVLTPMFKRAGAELKARANAIEVDGTQSRWSVALKTEKPLVDFVLALHREYKTASEKIAAGSSSSTSKPNTIERAMNRELT